MTARTERDKNISDVRKFVHLQRGLCGKLHIKQEETHSSLHRPEFELIQPEELKRSTDNEKVAGKMQDHKVNWSFICSHS